MTRVLSHALEAPVNRRGLLTAAACGVVCFAGAPALAAARTPRFPNVNALLEKIVATRAAPGALAAIGTGSAPPQYVGRGTLAFDSSRSVNADTIWRIYSMSKPVTGIAAMLLIAEGRLKLDQPVYDIIPAYASMHVLTDPANSLATRPARQAITIRHLLTHTAGLGYANMLKGPLAQEYTRLKLNPGNRHRADSRLSTEASDLNLATFAEQLATVPLIAEPGTKWNYSVGLDLLGRIIELVSGTPFDTFLETRLFEPLGMKDTGFVVPASKQARLATCYKLEAGKVMVADQARGSAYLTKPALPSGGGGLVSTARDYDRFLAMLANRGTLNGRRILPAEAVEMGTSNLLPGGTDMRGFLSPTGGDGFGAGGSTISKGPDAGSFGWGGAAGTIATVNTRTGRRIAGYINVLGNFRLAGAMPAAVRNDIG